MLHALLHHKLDEGREELERLEDALTSTVLGTLIMVGADETLHLWLAAARGCGRQEQSLTGGPVGGAWFWPALAEAEPDLVLRLGDQLLVVEAKLAADRHDRWVDDDGEEDVRASDQLVRQWLSLQPKHVDNVAYPSDLREAIACSNLTVVFLVDRRRLGRARRELAESAALLPPHADLRLLTWQDLHRLLCSEAVEGPHHWKRLLVLYLERLGLASFRGFRRASTSLGSFPTLTPDHWHLGGRRSLLRWSNVVQSFATVAAMQLLPHAWGVTSSGRTAGLHMAASFPHLIKACQTDLTIWTIETPQELS